MTRTILKVSGKDAHDFLQGLVTNDVDKLGQGLVYAALLTPQGKYLADFFLREDEDGILLDVDSALAPSLLQRLNMYRLRAEVQISETETNVYCGTGPAPDGALRDPRHPDLGWRLYGEKAGDDGSDWAAIRVAQCIPETEIELTSDSYILEMGFERLNGVDFKKGCYVGQEVTARMKHKTELRKGLASVRIDGAAPVGTDITANGKIVGTLLTQSGDQAIAYLRFDRASSDMQAGDATLQRT
ncbi:putative global regulator [Roseovarius albus]|uniref:Putative global regulator n=1 Tax=Roseovarius albus TaxID=1247867 RepID=A0A1X6Y943_9RHOB|nr:folate-binding protein YgfZ [Roseovarius albus]SLN13685.1 putative global regulator [Roseovarius albus]